MHHQKWKILNQQDISPSKWFPLLKDDVELPNGTVVEYYKSHLPNVAMVVPITKTKELIFVKQYKHGIGEICIEFPAGRIEHGKTPKQAAIAELREETGIVAVEQNLIELAELWTEPSKSTTRVSGFLITDVEITQSQQLEETEAIEVLKVPLSQLPDFVSKGELHGSDTLALLCYAQMMFPELLR